MQVSRQMGQSSVSGLLRGGGGEGGVESVLVGVAGDDGVAGDGGPVASVAVGEGMEGAGVDDGDGVAVYGGGASSYGGGEGMTRGALRGLG
jgi:hypothetical protein